MPSQLEDPPLPLSDPDAIGRVREALDRAAYSEARVAELLGYEAAPSQRTRANALPLLLWRTRQANALETLTRLFMLGVPVAVSALRNLPPTSVEDWVNLGLVRVSGQEAVPQVSLHPYREIVAAVDRARQPSDARHQVMEISASSMTLVQISIRRSVHNTLDLGTGSGVQALLAAVHSHEVVGVDCNERALAFAQFNALLNRRTNVEWLEGDLFEPVRGRQFDLIVVNPPFVISPESRTLASDSGLPGDQFAERIVRDVPQFLREGGYCQIVCNYVQLKGQDWRQRLAGWFEGSGCDAWVLHSRTEDAAAYAANRLREREGDDLRSFADRFQRWLAYYEEEQIAAISFGVITMRRRTGANWFRCDDAPEIIGPSGDAIALAFELHDFLEQTDDQALLAMRLRTAPELRWEQRLEVAADGWSPVESRLGLCAGLAFTGNVDAKVAALVARCRGDRPLRDVITEAARSFGQSPESAIRSCVGLVRRLVAKGILLPCQ